MTPTQPIKLEKKLSEKTSDKNYLISFLQDDSSNWVDFSDQTEWQGRNQLEKIGTLSFTGEALRGEIRQQLSSITLNNK